MTDSIGQTIHKNFDKYRQALFELLEQPSISTTGEGMNTAPDLVSEILSRFDFGKVTQFEINRYPVIYGEQRAEDAESAPTVLFYGHYDVQPPGDHEEWESPPFDPTIRDDRIYARGVGDNKGQFSTHIFAVHALREAESFPEVNVKILLDGGEESGSEGFREYLESNPDELEGMDLVYVADGPMFDSGTDSGQHPSIAYGNRGVLSFQLDLETANSDLHSGNYGGPIPNAATELVKVLASMRDGDEIVVDDFHDGVAVTEEDRAIIQDIPTNRGTIKEELDLSRFASELPYYERLLLCPTLTINSISSGYQGDGMKTVLPSTATAKLDCRLVPNQDPDTVFEAICDHVTSSNAHIEVTKQGTFPPMRTPIETPLSDPVIEALSEVWEKSPVEFPVLGGSLPAAYFRRVPSLSDVPILIVPYGNPDQGNHSPNEFMGIKEFENGIRTSAKVIQKVGRIAKSSRVQ